MIKIKIQDFHKGLEKIEYGNDLFSEYLYFKPISLLNFEPINRKQLKKVLESCGQAIRSYSNELNDKAIKEFMTLSAEEQTEYLQKLKDIQASFEKSNTITEDQENEESIKLMIWAKQICQRIDDTDKIENLDSKFIKEYIFLDESCTQSIITLNNDIVKKFELDIILVYSFLLALSMPTYIL